MSSWPKVSGICCSPVAANRSLQILNVTVPVCEQKMVCGQHNKTWRPRSDNLNTTQSVHQWLTLHAFLLKKKKRRMPYVESTSVRLSVRVWPSISTWAACWIFVKLCRGVCCRASTSFVSTRFVNGFLTVLAIFLDGFGLNSVYTTSIQWRPVRASFIKIGAAKAMLYFRVSMKCSRIFYFLLTILKPFGAGDI
jgi:hypothetical protein